MFRAPQTSKSALAALTICSAAALAAGMTVPTSPAASGSKSPSSTEAVATMMLAFPFEGGHQRFIDRGKTGVSPGDLFLSDGLPVLDNATGERIGSSDAVEQIVSLRHDGTVTSQSTLRLPGGHVELDGVVRHTDHPFRITVTGGTGRYLGVGGQLTLIGEDAGRKVNVMKLELVR